MEKALNRMPVGDIISLTMAKLVSMGYRPSSIKHYQNVWRQFSKYALDRGSNIFSEQLGADFLKSVYGWPSAVENNGRMVHAARAIRVLGDMQAHGLVLRSKRIVEREWEVYFTAILHRFKSHVAVKLSRSSVFRIEGVLVKFFTYLFAQGIKDCAHISIRAIDGFAGTLSGYTKKTLSVSMYSLRTFLGFLYSDGILKDDFRPVVPIVTHVNRRNVPATWSKEEINKILSVVDRANPCGKRDYAILITIARLGLRQSDIVKLCFENIDWIKCTLSLTQHKTQRHLTLPLPEDVGNAIIDYLKHGRPPSNEPYVFLKHIYPFEQMRTVYMLMDKYVRLAAIKRRPGQAKGPHTLRHSLASRMLDKRIPIETISAVLGHTSVNSTLDYLKFDVGSLAECAIDPEEALAHEYA